ncbi:MAG: phosphate/phosphite/phosphonate ABC transporter substrate-binding protein [Gammaproteobacteria bacterium]|nr:phosphate/phosphite/phosphonate ABC transporter substrate-binding protein [Gammaproteobacteria bacterium]
MAGIYKRHWISLLVIFATLCDPYVLAGDRDKAAARESGKNYLTFGFLPVESPVALFKRFAPLREYLSTQIQQEVRIETAKDFIQFSERTSQRQYDIVFTAPHMALLALDGEEYELAATFTEPLRSVIVVMEKSPIRDVTGLEGATIATPPSRAIVTLVGINYLASQGLKSVRYKTYGTHNAAYSAVMGGEADAAMIANFIAMKASSTNTALKIVAQSEPFPGIGILVAKDLPDTLKQDIKKAIWGMKELPHGRSILKTIAQPGYIEADKKQFEVLRPFAQTALP